MNKETVLSMLDALVIILLLLILVFPFIARSIGGDWLGIQSTFHRLGPDREFLNGFYGDAPTVSPAQTPSR